MPQLTWPEIADWIANVERLARNKSNRARQLIREHGAAGVPIANRMFRDVGRAFRILHSLDLMGGMSCETYETRLSFASDMAAWPRHITTNN